MEHGIANMALVPMRAQAAHRSEMVSQLLFGETFEIMERGDDWVRVITTFDGYEGWIHHLQFAPISQLYYDKVTASTAVLTTAAITKATIQNGSHPLFLPINSVLPLFDGNGCLIGNDTFVIENLTPAAVLLDVAYSFIHVPYVWGGRSHFGVDCSGFSQAVLRTQGINLKRDAALQAEQGTAVDFLQEARPGDLAFFDNEEGKITHVGIMIDGEHIIHASGKVKIDQIDNQGIYSAGQKKYTHKLRIIKRFF